MIDLLFYWFLPSSLMFVALRGLVHADGKRLRGLLNWQLNVVIGLSAVWPAGVLFLIGLAYTRLTET